MSKNFKIAHKKQPRMVESSLKTKRFSDPYAEGGEVEDSPLDILRNMNPEGAAQAEEKIKEKQRQDASVASEGMYAEGGSVKEEKDLESAASAVASIMARRRMARGGEILSEDDTESSDSGEAELSRNAEESQNQEDQLSFDALRKENYSESDALEDLTYPAANLEGDDIDADEHDMVSSIRKKIKRSPISR